MKKVLIIDDEQQLRALLRIILVREGFAVQEASDGRAGLALWRQSPADLVLTDLFMPETDGIEVIRVVKQSSPEAKIIAMTGGGHARMLEIAEAAKIFGAEHILYKPFGRESLLSAVNALLEPLSIS